MTPTSIRTGRQFDSVTVGRTIIDGETPVVAPPDANRVALSVALTYTGPTDLAGGGLIIGPRINGVVVPLSCLTAGHPACYLSVDKIGSALFAELYARQASGADIAIGVTTVRQVQELP
jgi:hypothetical protein